MVANPSGSWTPSTAEAYIDSQVATINTNLASETIARQTGDANLSTQLQSEMATRADQDANLNALINAGIREGGGVQFDTVPTQNSANGITSGGMYSTLKDPNVGFVEETLKSESNNLVNSKGIYDQSIYDLEGEVDFNFKSVTHYYINSSGTWVSQDHQVVNYWPITQGEHIRLKNFMVNSVYASYVIYSSEPTPSTTPYSVIRLLTLDITDIIAPISGYIASSRIDYGSNGDYSGLSLYRLSYGSNVKDVDYQKYLSEEYIFDGTQAQPVGELNNCYTVPGGTIRHQNNMHNNIYQIKIGDAVKISVNANAANFASMSYFTDIPTESSSPVRVIRGRSYNIDVSPINGYVMISSDAYPEVEISSKRVNDVVTKMSPSVDNYSTDSDIPQVIYNYYINSSGIWQSQSYQEVYYFKVSQGEKLKVYLTGATSPYASLCYFSSVPKVGVAPSSVITTLSGGTHEIVSPIDGWITLNGFYFGESLPKLYRESSTYINNMRNKPYYGKTCLYIGDSISTRNYYQWKGLIEENYNLNWVRDPGSGDTAPAEGGIPLIPPVTEGTKKSIWYRCANNRMSIYDFDIINLFGGTNDFSDSTVVGTVNDIAYVDNMTGFDSSVATSTRPETLTFASALKGCILMLKRDFPDKEIIVCTVMPTKLYGNQIDSVSGLSLSEAMAILQLKVANLYNLKCVPLYYDMKNVQNADCFADSAGVHPNMNGAIRIQAVFAQTLAL